MINLNNIDIARQHARQLMEECLRLQYAAKVTEGASKEQRADKRESGGWAELWRTLTGFGRRMF